MPVLQEHQEQIARIQISCQGQIQRPPVQELRPALFGADRMKAAERELRDLMAELRVQFDKVREKTAWLELKQSELRPDDEISLFGLMDAKQECQTEQSLLSGHALMAHQLAATKRIKLDRDSERLLSAIRELSPNSSGFRQRGRIRTSLSSSYVGDTSFCVKPIR